MTKEKLSPYQELCKFAEDYAFDIELDKPFKELPNLYLIIKDEKKVLAKIEIEDIGLLEKTSARILNDLSKSKND